MICPKCGYDQFKYIEERPKLRNPNEKWKRKNFETKCRKCGYEGKEY